jgi:DNA-binding MarR family transcriptional regulator/N-acetylglutamate synthase-like GNAT family acetyltransferase
MQDAAFKERVQAVRQFSRFYTKQLGILQEHLLGSAYSLAESRVLYELAHRQSCTAKEIGDDLGLDPGYLSRILARFARMRLIRRERSREDGRQVVLHLTEKGRATFESLNRESSEQVTKLLNRLADAEQRKLTRAMREVELTLSQDKKPDSNLVLREQRPGDMGWVIHRHGALYTQEYGWDQTFEALVAEIAAQFIKNFDPKRERCWIAEFNREPVGSVFLVKQSEEVAKLRLLLVEPHARGLGVGRRLVDECIRFARAAGYRKMILWTQSNLTAARNIYRRAGFKLVKEEPQRAFGADLVSETWELQL